MTVRLPHKTTDVDHTLHSLSRGVDRITLFAITQLTTRRKRKVLEIPCDIYNFEGYG